MGLPMEPERTPARWPRAVREQARGCGTWLLEPTRQALQIRLRPEYAVLPQYAELTVGPEYFALAHERQPDYMDILAPLVLYARKAHFEVVPCEPDGM